MARSSLVTLSWEKEFSAIHFQNCGLIDFVLREVGAKSTLDSIRCENTVRDEKRGHLSLTGNFFQ